MKVFLILDNKLMENPYFEFMAGFPVHCSFHQPCISCVDCNGARLKVPQKVTLKLFYCFSQSTLSQSNAVIRSHVLTLHWSTSALLGTILKLSLLSGNMCPPPSTVWALLIQYPPSHPDTDTSNELTIIFKLLSMRWYLHTS